MKHSEFIFSEIKEADKDLVSFFISKNWGSTFIISKGIKHNAADLPGFICRKHSEIVGLITYNICHDDCEIVTLNCEINNLEIGSELVKKVTNIAKANKCKKVWLVTTNDNTNAIRFYQKRGFEWTGFYKDAVKESRKLKPEIPEIGFDNIPVKHEIELEYLI
ncbi:GNAT family N-acetyltransferase [Bacteroidota bacterium]